MQDDLWKYIEQMEEGLAGMKKALKVTEPPAVRWARQMLSVLDEVDVRGGSVGADEFLDIGEMFGYQRQGMAGFYQQLVTSESGVAKLTEEGKSRLELLRKSYKKLPVTETS